MSECRYRLEPLVRLSDRALQLARRRVAAASREVVVLQSQLREAEARCDTSVAAAHKEALRFEHDASHVCAIAESRVASLLSKAASLKRQSERARQSLDEATSVRRCRLDEAREAGRDAELQRSTRERSLARVRERVRRRAERREMECAIETWFSTGGQIDPEENHAS